MVIEQDVKRLPVAILNIEEKSQIYLNPDYLFLHDRTNS